MKLSIQDFFHIEFSVIDQTMFSVLLHIVVLSCDIKTNKKRNTIKTGVELSKKNGFPSVNLELKIY